MLEGDHFSPEQAQSMLEQYDEMLPPDFRAFCLCILDRFEEALPFLEEALESEPEGWHLWFSKGFALASLERYAEAIQAFERVLELNPEHEGAREARMGAIHALQAEQRVPSANEIMMTLAHWLALSFPSLELGQRFLERYPELLGAPILAIVEHMYKELNEPGSLPGSMAGEENVEAEEKLALMRGRLELLRDIHRRGRTALAIREAHIDLYGGMALEMPTWLKQAIEESQKLIMAELSRSQIFKMGIGGLSRDTIQKMIAVFRTIVARAEHDPDVSPEMLAELHFFLQETLEKGEDAESIEIQEERLARLEQALVVYRRDRYPRRYAEIQQMLGLIYKQRQSGDRQQNLEEAIACYERALAINTAEDFPRDHAMNQYNLGTILVLASSGRSSEEEEQKFLKEALFCFEDAEQYFTRTRASFEYARIQKILGGVYSNYKENGRYVAVERALNHLQRALEIFTLERYPDEYAEVHTLLALFSKERVESAREKILEKALLSCKAALAVYTPMHLPHNYARVQQYLGDIYVERLAGSHKTNLEEAISCYQRAAQIFTAERYPEECAEVLNLLGYVYAERLTGTRQKNLQTAHAYYQRALELHRQHGSEGKMARIYYNLAILYHKWTAGNRQENQEQALAYCQRALEIYTSERFPEEYARAQNLLGSLHNGRIRGNARNNLEEAIRCYERALKIFTSASFRVDYAGTQHNLGNAYIERVAGNPRENKEKAIACYQNVLQIFTREDFPLEFASAHLQLGIAYRERIAGEQLANKEEAIAHLEQALEIFTYERSPQLCAKAHYNLGNVYKERVLGTREQNIEMALEHYRKGMKGTTLADDPVDYALTQDSLGVLYSQRIAGSRRANLEEALVCHAHALQVFTKETDPINHARVMINLGSTFLQRVTGDRHKNIERAIDCYKQALAIFNQETSPFDYAKLQCNLGGAYLLQVGGERRLYQEQAIECFKRALDIFSPENDPLAYAGTQTALGMAYNERVEGTHWKNVEYAISCYTTALQIFSREQTPLEYARTQNSLGTCYSKRRIDGPTENQERAIACFLEAHAAYADSTAVEVGVVLAHLGSIYSIRWAGEQRDNLDTALDYFKQAETILSHDSHTREYAGLQLNMANAYAKRIGGEKAANEALALACCQRALEVFRLESYPQEYRTVQLNMALIEKIRRNWPGAHEAYQNALAAQDLLVTLGAGVAGRDFVLSEIRETDPATEGGYALTRLDRAGEAAVSFERGRARGLVEAIALRAADPVEILDPDLQARYKQARSDLMHMQGILNISASSRFDIGMFGLPSMQGESGARRYDIIMTEAYRERWDAFQAILQEVRTTQGPLSALNTQVDEATILRAAQHCGLNHALVYLVGTSDGGVAVAALSGNAEQQRPARFATLDLPRLTADLVANLLEDRLLVKDLPVSCSYGAAQAGFGFGWFLENWQGQTFRERALALHTVCEARDEVCTFDRAAWQTTQAPWLARQVDTSLEEMLADDNRELRKTMDQFLLQEELRRCLGILEEVALRPLATWLEQEGVTGCTLIPCGALLAFPLQAAEIRPGTTLADLFVTSVAPNARSLLIESRPLIRESAIYALGDPRPTRQQLPLGEAEAWTLAALGQKYGMRGYALVREEATRAAFGQAVEHGYIVDASCHAHFDFLSPLDSRLILAQHEHVLLYELLSHNVDLLEEHPHNINMRGLRLLLLSSCQSMVIDLRGATNEVHSLAAGMIQAGARAVLATLWPVDDMATYLLVVRFAQEWLPDIEREPPATALAHAQRWLRNLTARELRTWAARDLPSSSESRASRHDDRYGIERARESLLNKARSYADPETRPYADPIYWAGFQIMGW
jgi:tetratricopeptide (TPR) repeat protein/CHAT domain-containing protein